MPQKQAPPLAVRITPTLKKEIQKAAKGQNVPTNRFVVQAIMVALEAAKKEQEAV